MGVLNELVLHEPVLHISEVTETQLVPAPTVTAAEFEELTKFYRDRKGTKGTSEVEIDVGLNLIRLYAGVYESGRLTNRIINVTKPWDVRVSWCLVGCLKELICGKWCVNVHFEAIGDTGKEFHLHYPEFHFDCHDDCFHVSIPGREIPVDRCTTPYKVVATLIYKSLCGKPGPILGFVEFPTIQFYHAK